MGKNVLSEHDKKSLIKRIPLFVAYSLFLGFIAMNICRIIESTSMGVGYGRIPMVSVIGVSVMIIVAIVFFTLLYLFQLYYNEKNNILSFIDSIVGHPLTFILLAVISWRIWYFGYFESSTVYFDSSSYTEYDYNIFLGQVDIFRTPIYPWFIKLVSFVTGAEYGTNFYYANIVHAQMILSVVGVAILYFAADYLFKNKMLKIIAALLYGIAPSVLTWDLCILTESISMFVMVVCIYLIARYLKKPSVPIAVTLGIFTLIMTLTRPTFVYMYAIIGVFFVARLIFTKFDRKRALCGLLALAISGGMLLGYCGLNKKDNDCFAISSVGTGINKMYMLIDLDIYKNDNYPEITKYIDEQMKYKEEYSSDIMTFYVTQIIKPANEKFGYTKIAKYVNDTAANNEVFNEYTINKFTGELLNWQIAIDYSSRADNKFLNTDNFLLGLTFPFTFGACFVLVLITVIFAIYQLIRRKIIVWPVIGLCAIIFAHLFVSIYGSMAEYSRLSIMIVPCVYLLLIWYIDLIMSPRSIDEYESEIISRGDIVFEKNAKTGIISKKSENNEINNWVDSYFGEQDNINENTENAKNTENTEQQ